MSASFHKNNFIDFFSISIDPIAVLSFEMTHSSLCVIKKLDQHVQCWAYSSLSYKKPIVIPDNLGSVRSIRMNDVQACAIREKDQHVQCWSIPAGLHLSFNNHPISENLGPILNIKTRFNVFDSHVVGCVILAVDQHLSCWGDVLVPPDLGPVLSVEIGPSAHHYCVIKAQNRKVQCWKMINGEIEMINMPDDFGAVIDIQLSFNESIFAIRAKDGLLQHWNWKKEQAIKILPQYGSILSLLEVKNMDDAVYFIQKNGKLDVYDPMSFNQSIKKENKPLAFAIMPYAYLNPIQEVQDIPKMYFIK